MNRGSLLTHVVRRKAVWSTAVRLVAAAAVVLGAPSCGDLQREGQSSSFLIISELVAASGAEPTKFGGTLYSDVETIVDDVPTVYSDLGRVTFALGLKDPGSSTSPAAPSQANFITVERFHVRYVRADGRNTPGVDVPYAFDGAFTATVGAGERAISFEIVRHIAKNEAPLAALKRNGVIVNTLGEVTFYGHDQTGREVSVTAVINVEFANFGDPK